MMVAVGALLTGCGESEPRNQLGTPSATQTSANTGIVQPSAPRKDTRGPTSVPQGSGFDFYVLSLSWSPTWCADNDRSGKTQQCAAGHGLIVHGLWPQNERGYPESCPSNAPNRVPEALGRSLFDIMPSMGLIGHEWRKHGVCSGLSQSDYFTVLRAARERIVTPPVLAQPGKSQNASAASVEADFISANPGLTKDAVAISCNGRQLDEIRICLTKDLAFRPCREVAAAGCTAPSLSIPAPPPGKRR